VQNGGDGNAAEAVEHEEQLVGVGGEVVLTVEQLTAALLQAYTAKTEAENQAGVEDAHFTQSVQNTHHAHHAQRANYAQIGQHGQQSAGDPSGALTDPGAHSAEPASDNGRIQHQLPVTLPTRDTCESHEGNSELKTEGRCSVVNPSWDVDSTTRPSDFEGGDKSSSNEDSHKTAITQELTRDVSELEGGVPSEEGGAEMIAPLQRQTEVEYESHLKQALLRAERLLDVWGVRNSIPGLSSATGMLLLHTCCAVAVALVYTVGTLYSSVHICSIRPVG